MPSNAERAKAKGAVRRGPGPSATTFAMDATPRGKSVKGRASLTQKYGAKPQQGKVKRFP